MSPQSLGEVRENTDVRIDKAVRGIKKFLNIDGESMDLKGFQGYVAHHSLVLFPAFVMRSNLRTHITDAMKGTWFIIYILNG